MGFNLGIALGSAVPAYQQGADWRANLQAKRLANKQAQADADAQANASSLVSQVPPPGTPIQDATAQSSAPINTGPIDPGAVPTVSQPSSPNPIAAGVAGAATGMSSAYQAAGAPSGRPAVAGPQTAVPSALPGGTAPVAVAQTPNLAGSGVPNMALPQQPQSPGVASAAPTGQAPSAQLPQNGTAPGQYAASPPQAWTQDARNNAIAQIYISSGNPRLMAIGQDMQTQQLKAQQMAQTIQQGNFTLASQQYNANVDKAYHVAQMDPDTGMHMLENTVSNGVGAAQGMHAVAAPADGVGNEGKYVVTHYDSNNKVHAVDAPQTMEQIFSRAKLSPEDFEKAQQSAAESKAKLYQGLVYQQQAETMRRENAAGKPEADVAATKARSAADTASVASQNAYRAVQVQTLQHQQNVDKITDGITEQLRDPNISPEQTNRLRNQLADIQGRALTQHIENTPQMDSIMQDPGDPKAPMKIWAPGLKMYVPMGVPADEIAKDPGVQAGRIRYGYNGGTWGYQVAGVTGKDQHFTGSGAFREAQIADRDAQKELGSKARGKLPVNRDDPYNSMYSTGPTRGIASGAAGVGDMLRKTPQAVREAASAIPTSSGARSRFGDTD